MPPIKLVLKVSRPNWTKLPNPVIDHLMPTLKDTELRVLLVVTRQTIGWNRMDPTARLTYRALKNRTGRSTDAIASALKALARRGVIHIAGRKQTPHSENRTVSSPKIGEHIKTER